MLTRRSFVAATATLSMMPKTVVAAASNDVVIIGGGLAGLHAASVLTEMGMRPIVLEAANQVGGRAKTVRTGDGLIDIGASQVGRGYARVIDACQRLGLNLVREDRDLLTFGTYYRNNWIDSKTWDTNPLNKCVGAERAIAPLQMGPQLVAKYNPLIGLDDWLDPKFANSDISLRALLKRHGHSEQAIDLARISAPGVSIDDTSCLRMWQEETRGAYDRTFENANGLAMSSNIEGGCQRLPEAMAAKLGDAVRLGKKVALIDMTDRAGTVTCTDGSVYKGRFIISAIPFTMLRTVAISAAPNASARQAITQMSYASTARMFVTVDRPFWLNDGLPASFSTDGPMGMFWAIDNHKGSGSHRALIVMVGKTGLDIGRLHPRDAEAFLMDELARLRPASKGLVKVATYKDWGSDPLQRGCSFSLAPGQINAFARKMVAPWQVMHFAGEHTRRVDFGMEAAFESGERAAFEIVARA